MGEIRGPGCGDPWGFNCGCSFKLMDLSFPGKRSHFLSVCLSPALLLNQGEWSYLLALLERGALKEASGRVRVSNCSSRLGLRQVDSEIKVG